MLWINVSTKVWMLCSIVIFLVILCLKKAYDISFIYFLIKYDTKDRNIPWDVFYYHHHLHLLQVFPITALLRWPQPTSSSSPRLIRSSFKFHWTVYPASLPKLVLYSVIVVETHCTFLCIYINFCLYSAMSYMPDRFEHSIRGHYYFNYYLLSCKFYLNLRS